MTHTDRLPILFLHDKMSASAWLHESASGAILSSNNRSRHPFFCNICSHADADVAWHVQDVGLWKRLAAMSTELEPPYLRQALYCLNRVSLPGCQLPLMLCRPRKTLACQPGMPRSCYT